MSVTKDLGNAKVNALGLTNRIAVRDDQIARMVADRWCIRGMQWCSNDARAHARTLRDRHDSLRLLGQWHLR